MGGGRGWVSGTAAEIVSRHDCGYGCGYDYDCDCDCGVVQGRGGVWKGGARPLVGGLSRRATWQGVASRRRHHPRLLLLLLLRRRRRQRRQRLLWSLWLLVFLVKGLLSLVGKVVMVAGVAAGRRQSQPRLRQATAAWLAATARRNVAVSRSHP